MADGYVIEKVHNRAVPSTGHRSFHRTISQSRRRSFHGTFVLRGVRSTGYHCVLKYRMKLAFFLVYSDCNMVYFGLFFERI